MEKFTLNKENKNFFVDSVAQQNRGRCVSIKDMVIDKALPIYVQDQALHDANFAFLSTSLAKLHNKMYEPKYYTTYLRDIPTPEVGGGFVDYIEYFTVDWSGIMDEYSNIFGNAANYIPRVNAGLSQNKANVYTFEVAYDLRFVDLEKMKTVQLQKSIEEIYRNIITAGWDLFVQKVVYLGIRGGTGLFNSDKVLPTTINNSNATNGNNGFDDMTDDEIISALNGIIAYFLENTGMNFNLLPDTFRVPSFVGQGLTSRMSALYTKSLRKYFLENNLAFDESSGQFNITLESRNELDKLGVGGHGRIVAYKKDIDFIRLDIPYPMQHYITLPNMGQMAYTSAFVGQVSELQLPYNTSANEFGPVAYFDFIK